MSVPAIENQLLQTTRQFEPDMTAFCSRLLQIPSVNGLNDEIDLAEAIAQQARQLGLHVQITGENPRRPNIIISTAPEGSTGLLLIGHLDTVPPGDTSRWTHPPFSGAIADGRIYGRGAIDTKGGMTAALYALAALKRIDGALVSGRAQLICVPDEESGATGDLGIKFLHANGLLHGLGAIYAYSGYQITLGHRGVLRYRLFSHGKSVHTGSTEWQDEAVGANAVTGMARLLLEIERVELPHSSTKYFESYKTIFTPGTMISGGVSINVVPDLCEALLDIRLTPEFSREQIEARLQDCINHALRHSPKIQLSYELLNHTPAAICDENAAIVTTLESVVQQIKGFQPPRVVAGPANEGYLLIERGIPTICGFGPTGENAHAADEYVEIQSLSDTAAIFALTAHRLSDHVK
ncbi:MAG: ArgE/DapE family deacylase [Anaerolineae bacterium]|nr:ArgE/DapE family deacylase [Anaerolineae bacterium]